MPKEKLEIHPVDAYAGQRLRDARKLRGISQAELGNRLSYPVTFQQIQKYERGTNRISISRMYEFMTVLELPLTFFMPESGASAKETALLNYYRLLSREARDGLLTFFCAKG